MPDNIPLTDTEKQKMQQYISENVASLGINEAYSDLLKGIFAPLYQRKPVVSPVEFDSFQNPMWSVYERETSISADRLKRLKDYADMGDDTTIASALDIYSSEACQYSDEHDSTIWCQSQDPRVLEEWNRLTQQVGLEDYIEGIARDTAKNGDDFIGPLWNFRDGVVNLKFVEPDEVTIKTDRYGRLIAYRYQDSKKDIEPWAFVQYKNIGTKKSVKHGGAVYGTSVIEPARKTWRQLKMMEDALAIWRMDIGTRRLVFYVDIGNLDQKQAMDVVREWERAYKKRPFFNPQTGEFISRHSPLAMDNHIFWPIRPNSRSRVEYIGGDANVTAVADVDYFRRKLASSVKIPMAYLGGEEYSSVRSGLAQLDVYFARMVKKLQRSMIRGTVKLFFTHLRIRETKYNPSEVRLSMQPVSGIEEMQRLESLTAAVNLAAMMFQTLMSMGIPPNFCAPYILKDILKISDEDLSSLPIDQNQVQQMQQQMGGEQGAPGAGPGALPAEARDDIKSAISEELSKPGNKKLALYLATESEAPDEVFIPEYQLPPHNFRASQREEKRKKKEENQSE